MKREFGLIIKMPTEQASQEGSKERNSKIGKLVSKWAL